MGMLDKESPVSRHKRNRQSLIANLFIVLGLILASAAILLVVHDRKSEPKPPPGAVQTAAKSSIKPTQAVVDNYTVAPDLPKYIAIPAMNISRARVVRLGLTKNDQIAVPDNIYDTGWYDGSAKPGQSGAMFIYGHVSSWAADGVFYNLKKLKPGDKIIITRGDDKTFTYQVASTKVYSHNKVDMNQALTPASAGKPGLNLMTCSGQVIEGTSEFSERLVVFTSLVGS